MNKGPGVVRQSDTKEEKRGRCEGRGQMREVEEDSSENIQNYLDQER